MTFARKFGENVRQVRSALGLTQEELAGLCRLHPTQLSNIERGKSEPGAKTVFKLIWALETDAETLYEGISWDPERGVFIVDPDSGH